MTDPFLKPKPGRARTADTSSVRTLERGLSVLAALAEVREASLTQLSRRVGLSVSTVYRLLETLRQQGFVEWNGATGVFSVGLKAYQVGAAFSEGNVLLKAAQAEMRALVDDLNESANLAILRESTAGNSEAVYVQQVEGRQLVRMFTQLGAAAPLHCSGVGKVLLAWQEQATVKRQVGEGPFTAFTPHSITTLPEYLTELERVRLQGYALDDQERELGVRCVAAPIRDHTGQVVAALSVSAPTTRLSGADVPRFLKRVQQATQAISARLGWRAG